MKYKNVEIGDKPTKEQFKEYVSRMGYILDVEYWYNKYEARGWKTKKKCPIKSLEAIVNVINGIVIQRRKSNRDTNTGKKIKQTLAPKKTEKTMIEYTKEKPLRVFESFAGYGSQSMALQRLKDNYPTFDFNVVGFSEIDVNAIKAYKAVHGDIKNFGDMTKIDWEKVPDFDLFTYSFPCQDISSSGKQRGFEEGAGTRSSLLWECKKAIEAKKPRFLMMENVKALVSAKFLPFLHQWQTWLYQQGYENFTQVLNASSYNVPQNRERVFMISILRTDREPNPSFYFPNKMKLEKRIKDILEPNVDESFYLSDKALEYFCRVNNGLNGSEESSCVGRVSNSQDGVVSGVNAVAPTLTEGHANQPKLFNEEE